MTMNKIKLINIPALNETAEGRLKGGFSIVGRARVQGGPNDDCANNDICFDNKVCWNNKDWCQGNHSDTNCGSGTAGSTGTSTGTSTSIPSLAIGNIFSF